MSAPPRSIVLGDCREVLRGLPENSLDSVVTDPPYLLDFMGKSWDRVDGHDLPTSEIVFRSWLAGLIAGEGCFRIHREKQGAYYACAFSIHMRADEAPLLRALQRHLGIGTVTEIGEVENNFGVKSAPSATWIVQSREDCNKLASILKGVPLYAKKQREYDLWCRALGAWNTIPKGNRWSGPRDNSFMEKLWLEMKDLRPFDKELAESDFNPFGQPEYLFHYQWAKEVLRVLKPGGHLLAFGGTRTYHRLACAVEDAGFEIRDMISWIYGQGFPKSLDVAKAIDKAARGVPQGGSDPTSPNHGKFKGGCSEENKAGRGFGAGPGQFMVEGGEKNDRKLVAEAEKWSGWGTALKPACEPIVLARKPLSEGNVAANVLKWGTGALSIESCRVPIGEEDDIFKKNPHTNGGFGHADASVYGDSQGAPQYDPAKGRWPANVIHDGSEEVLSAFPDAPGQLADASDNPERRKTQNVYGAMRVGSEAGVKRQDQDKSAARFFYCAKASKSERGEGNSHPTVKPLALMRYLITLVTPPGGTVLDPFLGSGTTAMAARDLGFGFVGIEKEAPYFEIAKKRLGIA